MADEDKTKLRLEIGHVLFIDVVGYSKLLVKQQSELLSELNEVVSGTNEFHEADAAGKLIRLPTGDGMALVFRTDPEAPAQCAMEIARALKSHPAIQLRMGIHSGPVNEVADVNQRSNIAGAGINMAQRVMDCGDAGHILLSRHVAEDLEQDDRWRPLLHDLGTCEVKHGMSVGVTSLYSDEVGNPQQPQKLRTARAKARHKKQFVGATVLAIIIAVIAGYLLYSRRLPALTSTSTIVLADFANKTGDAVFDDTLKQAVTVALRQSPFLNFLSDDELKETLKQMGRGVGERLTPELARDLCLRSNCNAMLAGSISSLGTQYVIGLKAVQCSDGDTLAAEQVQAIGKEQVLPALDKATRALRKKLGESIATIKKFDVPLAQATTPSLEALKAYSIGRKLAWEKSSSESIPFYERAIELDPNFALAHVGLAFAYLSIGRNDLCRQNLQEAYALRDRVSENERLAVSASYYAYGTGETEKAIETYKLWAQTYPRNMAPHTGIAAQALFLGQYDKALSETQEALRLMPPDALFYWSLMVEYIGLERWDEAKAIYDKAVALSLDNAQIHMHRYFIAFHDNDVAEMERQQAWARGKPEETLLLLYALGAEGYAGHLRKAQEIVGHIVETSLRSGDAENAAAAEFTFGIANADFGNIEVARQLAASVLTRGPTKEIRTQAATVLARTGEIEQPASLAEKLAEEYPLDSILNGYDIPVIRAAIEISRGNPRNAVDVLKRTVPYELSAAETMTASYLRGLAFLELRDGGAAATEFQRILDHPGIVRTTHWGALAHLQLARAKLMSGDKEAARKAYRDFLTLWKNADEDIPILRQAKAEYAKLE